MNIDIFNNGQVPRPKGEIRIERLNAMPYPDHQRIFIEIDVTPFQERPNLVVSIQNEDGGVVEEMSIIETMHFNMEFTMHLRGMDDTAGDYSVVADLFYEKRNPPQDRKVAQFTIEAEDSAE